VRPKACPQVASEWKVNVCYYRSSSAGHRTREEATMKEAAAAASGQHDPFTVDEDAALATLELTWSYAGYHAFSADGGPWCAVSSAGEVLTGGTPDDLDRTIRAHWGTMQ
jgi:hypothetical protein